MKNKILTGITLLLPLSFSMAKESIASQLCLSQPETEIAQCLADEYAKYDLALNNNYKEIMKNLSDEDKKAFKAQQIAWIKEKEKRCAPLASENGKQACLLDATILKNGQLEILTKPFEAIWLYEYSTDSDEEIYDHNSQHNFYLQSKDIICGIETSEKPPIYRNVKLQKITNSLAKVIKSYDCRFETDCANINIDTDGEDGIYLNSEEKYIDSYISICDGKLTFSTWDGDDGSLCNTNTILQKEILSIDKKNMYIKENPWLKACLNNSKE